MTTTTTSTKASQAYNDDSKQKKDLSHVYPHIDTPPKTRPSTPTPPSKPVFEIPAWFHKDIVWTAEKLYDEDDSRTRSLVTDNFLVEVRDTIYGLMYSGSYSTMTSDNAGIVLQNAKAGNSPATGETGFENFVHSLAKLVGADLLSFDLDELDDLGFAFAQQDDVLSTFDEGKGNRERTKISREESFLKGSAYSHALRFFGPPVVRNSSQYATGLHRAGLGQVMNLVYRPAAGRTSGPDRASDDTRSARLKAGMVLIHVRNAHKVLGHYRCQRVLGRLRDHVAYERFTNQRQIVLVVSGELDAGQRGRIERKLKLSPGCSFNVRTLSTPESEMLDQCKAAQNKNMRDLKRP